MIVDSLIDGDAKKPEEQKKEESKTEETKESVYGIEKKHLKTFLNLIATHAGSLPENVVDFELSMYDTNPATIIGLHKEFISSPRIDNMMSSLCATFALSERAEVVTDEKTIEMIILYDHEEIGSESAQGAASALTNDLLKRVFSKLYQGQTDYLEDYLVALKHSLFVSADMAHAQHPNYAGKHQSNHTPRMH